MCKCCFYRFLWFFGVVGRLNRSGACLCICSVRMYVHTSRYVIMTASNMLHTSNIIPIFYIVMCSHHARSQEQSASFSTHTHVISMRRCRQRSLTIRTEPSCSVASWPSTYMSLWMPGLSHQFDPSRTDPQIPNIWDKLAGWTKTFQTRRRSRTRSDCDASATVSLTWCVW